ncbi:MAG: hypothetical protein K6L76_05650 [Agarilytica sp.]
MNPNAPHIDVRDLVSHRPPMLLIDGLLDYGDDYAKTFINHYTPSIFANSNGDVPNWVGIEYMAQAIAVFAGLEHKKLGLDPKIGFLMGTRKYTPFVDVFKKGQYIEITATRQYLSDEDRIALFQCTISAAGQHLAEADIKAIQPDDPKTLFQL